MYLFFNEGAKPSSHTLTLLSEGKKAEVWNPATGDINELVSSGRKGALQLQVALEPYETRLVLLR